MLLNSIVLYNTLALSLAVRHLENEKKEEQEGAKNENFCWCFDEK